MALLSFVSEAKKKSGSNKNEVQLMKYYPIEGVLKEKRRKEKYLFLRIET